MVAIFELDDSNSQVQDPKPVPKQMQTQHALVTPALSATTPPPVSVFIATPAFGCRMDIGFVISMLRLQTHCTNEGIQLMFQAIGNESLITRARNILTETYLQTPCTHLLFLDADISFAPETIVSMVRADKDVISCLYPKKNYDFEKVREWHKNPTQEPIHQVGLDFNINLFSQNNTTSRSHVQEGNLVRVLDAATGCLLIKRDVIQKMKEHYRDKYYVKNDILGSNIKDYVALFDTAIDPENRRYCSEDFSWCRRWQAMGGEVWADISQPLIHRGYMVVDADITQRLKRKVSYDI